MANNEIPLWAFGTPKRETEVVSPIESIEKALENVEEKLQDSEIKLDSSKIRIELLCTKKN